MAACLLLSFVPAAGSTLKGDEEVLFFPMPAYLDTGAGKWKMPVHGWVFEPEEDSVWRSTLVEELLGWLELRADSVDKETFRRRARMFLVDNERGKSFTIKVGGKSSETHPSAPNGHFKQLIELDHAATNNLPSGTWFPFRIDQAQTGERRSAGRVQLVPPTGLSVISDIDDTIKVSNVLDKKQLLENTFLKKFKPIPGMSEKYREWARSGAVFHYVSGSPWQLYPALEAFMSAEQFPDGSVSLRDFRVRDRTFFNLFSSPEKSKAPAIELLFTRYPGRKFILVGDSGEKDPEIYGALVRQFPHQVVRIFIRNVPGSDGSPERFEAAFDGLEAGTWKVFSDPGELKEVYSFEANQGSGETGKRGE